MSSTILIKSVQRGLSVHSSRTINKFLLPSVFSHDVRLSISTLRRNYASSVQQRGLHIRRSTKEDEIVGKESEAASSFQESDVVKEVRESIEHQKRIEDMELKNIGEESASSIKKGETSTSADSEAYSKTVEKLMNSEDVSPIMKRVLEKEMHRAKMNEPVDPPKPAAMSKEEEEVSEWIASEENIAKQATEAIESLERSLESDACPEFMKPWVKKLINKMKKLKGDAQENIRLMKEENAAKVEEGVGAKAKEGSKVDENLGEKTTEEVGSTSTEPPNAAAGDGNKSDFMKNLKPSSNQKNEWVTYLGMSVLFTLVYMYLNRNGETQPITYDEFVKDLLLTRHAKSITIKHTGLVLVEIEEDFESLSGKQYVTTKEGKKLYYSFNVPEPAEFMKNVEEMELEAGWSRFDFIPMNYRDSALPRNIVPILFDLLLLFWIFGPMLRGKGGMNNMMSKAMGIGPKNIEIVKQTGVTFKDVAGIDEAKTEIMEFIDFLKNSDKYAALGAKLPKGAILTGPPGTGKTLLVKAAAGEANVPFISMSGSDFVELFVGMGAKRVRELFAEARKNAPCIVFIDEIDAIGKKRSEGKFSGSNDEREQTLNQILIEMDGFKPRDGITIFAGTNRVDVLDPALLRAGRFDRHIAVDKPDLNGRKEIAKIYLAKIKIDGDLDDIAEKLAEMTPGYTGADLCNIVNEAAIIAIRNKHEKVQLTDLISAVDRILCGLEKKHNIMTPAEKRRIAYHEAGHAMIGWMSEHVDPMLKVTIVPRANGALGFTQNLPKEIPLYSQDEMREMLVQLMGGRAAEKIFCGNMTTGASDDLNKATKLAYGMVAGYGFNDVVGPVNYQQEEGYQKPYSESTGKVIDEEAQKILKQSMEKAIAMLEENREKMVEVAELLLKRETITSVDMENICGARRGRSPTNYMDIMRGVEEKGSTESTESTESTQEQVKETVESEKPAEPADPEKPDQTA